MVKREVPLHNKRNQCNHNVALTVFVQSSGADGSQCSTTTGVANETAYIDQHVRGFGHPPILVLLVRIHIVHMQPGVAKSPLQLKRHMRIASSRRHCCAEAAFPHFGARGSSRLGTK